MAIRATYTFERYFKLPSWISPEDVTYCCVYDPDVEKNCKTKYMAFIKYDEMGIYEKGDRDKEIYTCTCCDEQHGDQKRPDDGEVIEKDECEWLFEDCQSEEDEDEDE